MSTIHTGQLLAKNLCFFREKVPSVYAIVQGHEPERAAYRIHPARKVDAITIEKYDGNRWHAIHSIYDPLQEAERWAQPVLHESTKEVVLFGFGFGYYAEALLTLNPSLRFYIIEPDLHVFLHSLEVRDWTTFPWKQVSYFGFGNTEADLSALHQSYFKNINSSFQMIELPAYMKIYADVYKLFTETLKTNREEYVQNMTATLYFQKMWARNAMKNLQYVAGMPSAYSLRSKFRDRIVILTASGPSLTEALPLIRKAQQEQKAIIAAAGTSVNSLLKHGITPDVLISYDPNEPNYHMLKPVFQHGIPLLFASTIYYQIMEEYKGPSAYFLTNQDYIYPYIDRKVKPEEILQDAPTVTLIAMQLLCKLECKEIYLAGQDLAYINKQAYAAGTSAHHDAVNTNAAVAFQQVLTVENNQGEIAETNESFKTMIASINSFFTQYPVTNIYNLSKYGAKLVSIPYVPLEKLEAALIKEPAVPFIWDMSDANLKKRKKLLDKLYKDVQSCAYDIRHLEGLLKRMQREDGLKLDLQERMVLEYNAIVDRFLGKSAFIGLFYPWMQVYLQYMQRAVYEIKNLPIREHFAPIRDLLERFVAEAKTALQFYEENLKESGK